jgi:hypothetical protein
MPPDEVKDNPGWKTTEFWLTLAAVVVTYLVSTELGDETTWLGKSLAVVAVVLASLGYSVGRSIVKKARIQNGKV